MAGIYDIFKLAASGVEKVPWRWQLLGGTTAGAVIGGMYGDKDTPFADRIVKGATVGAVLGVTAYSGLRAAGRVAQGGESLIKSAAARKYAQYQKVGIKALGTPGMLMLGGAVAGAAIAGPGHRMQGAAIGGGLGFVARPLATTFKWWEYAGKVPGAQTGILMAAAAVPIAAGAIRRGPSGGGAIATLGQGGQVDYEPMSGDMNDRLMAMNASGDIVLGLHGRQHG